MQRLEASDAVRHIYIYSCFDGLVVSMLASGTRVRGFKPGRRRRIFSGEKILSMPSFGSKAVCPMSQICGMLKNPVGHRQNLPAISRPIVPHFATRSARVVGTWRHLATRVGTSKGRGKQWQTTPKNVPRTQRTRAIPVAWMGSGSCQTGPRAEY
jgi:hypothetical protein